MRSASPLAHGEAAISETYARCQRAANTHTLDRSLQRLCAHMSSFAAAPYPSAQPSIRSNRSDGAAALLTSPISRSGRVKATNSLRLALGVAFLAALRTRATLVSEGCNAYRKAKAVVSNEVIRGLPYCRSKPVQPDQRIIASSPVLPICDRRRPTGHWRQLRPEAKAKRHCSGLEADEHPITNGSPDLIIPFGVW